MNKLIVFTICILSLFIFTGCDGFFVDDETRAIAKTGHYTDCASLDTSENKNRIERCYSYVGKQQDES